MRISKSVDLVDRLPQGPGPRAPKLLKMALPYGEYLSLLEHVLCPWRSQFQETGKCILQILSLRSCFVFYLKMPATDATRKVLFPLFVFQMDKNN